MQESIRFANGLQVGNDRSLTIIAGPCLLESSMQADHIAGTLAYLCKTNGLGFIFKASYDKANRTKLESPRQVMSTMAALAVLEALPFLTTTDVHTESECAEAAAVVDLIQIPAMLSRQTDLLRAAKMSGRPVNIKKGQGASPESMRWAAGKVFPRMCMLTERGTTFGYEDLVVDMRSLARMKETGHSVVFDATHSTAGQRDMAPVLARAAVATGIAAVFIECHENPEQAPSDGPSMMRLSDMPRLLEQLAYLDLCTKGSLAS